MQKRSCVLVQQRIEAVQVMVPFAATIRRLFWVHVKKGLYL
jgi:hypothetical protein